MQLPKKLIERMEQGERLAFKEAAILKDIERVIGEKKILETIKEKGWEKAMGYFVDELSDLT